MSNIRLHYQEFGKKDAPAIIFLHGFLGSSEDWREITTRLSKEFRCILIDLPGHGKSLNIDENLYKMKNVMREIMLLLDSLLINKFNLIGYSMGGRLALYIATHSNKVNKLILESSSPGLRTAQERNERIETDNLLIEKIREMDFSDFINEWYNMPFFKTMIESKKFSELIERRMKNDLQGLINSLIYMGTGIQPSLWSEWEKLQAKTLLIVGEHDEKYKSIAEEMIYLRKKTKLKVISGAGHNTHFERTNLFVNYVFEFLCK